MTLLINSASGSWASTVLPGEKIKKKNIIRYFTLVEPKYSQHSDVYNFFYLTPFYIL